MKKLLFTIASALILCSASMKAQITLDTTVRPLISRGEDFYTVQISANETKYYFADTVTNTFNLYNMDFTPFIANIAVPEPFAITSPTSMQVLYLSRTLFDCDSSNIEYAYYSTRSNAKPFRVMRTDGTVLLYVDSANGPYCIGSCLGLTDAFVPIRNTSDGAKLFLQSGKNSYQEILIYSLCGELPVEVFDFSQFQQAIVSVFPNPSMGLLAFQVNLLDNMQEYDLIISDSNAREIKREKINALNNKYVIDVADYSSGAYYYSLSLENKIIKSGKFILNK